MIWYLLLVAAVGWFVGAVMGIRSERDAWTMRAFSRDRFAPNTPHHANGTFYYVVPEEIFVNDFQRKPAREQVDATH